MNLKQLFLTQNACYISGKKMTPKGIMVHSTGANNPRISRYVGPDDGLLGANKYGNHWNQNKPDGRSVCVHGFIGLLGDDKTVATYQTLPWDMAGWHSGSGAKGNANNMGYIGFEICEDGLSDPAYFARVYQEAAELCAMLCKTYGIAPDKPALICHSEGNALGIASNHADVMHWWPKHGKSMDTFRAEVKRLMGTAAPPPAPAPAAQLYRVRKTWADSKTQTGAYKNLGNAKADADKHKAQGYKVFDENGAVVYDPAPADKTIWDYLKGRGLNDCAVAGLMGNLFAESGLKPTNLQNGFEGKLGMNDAVYTAAVDSGAYANFVRDSAGYGLAQWTFWSRKQALLDYTKAVGASIGDLTAQLGFLWQELQGYKAVLSALKSAATVRQASDAVLLQYERPDDQSEAVQVRRAGYGQIYYDKYVAAPVKTPEGVTVDNALADGVITDRTHWLGVLSGIVTPNPANIKTLMDKAHEKISE